MSSDLSQYGTWCPHIYHGLYIDRWNDDEVRIAPCCQAKYAIEPRETFNFATSPYLASLREQFDRGEKPEECDRCWDFEKYNANTAYRSRRQKSIETFEREKKKTVPDRRVMLSLLDYAATWVCNLACVMCRPINSSLWSAELKQTKKERKATGRLYELKNLPNLIQPMEFDEFYQVHFNGGEPLIGGEHIKVLRKLELEGRLTNTRISYNTNGTIYPSPEVIALWAQAKVVHVSFSLDAIGPAYDYIRYPTTWDLVSNNILRMKQEMPKNVEFGCTAAVGTFNVLEMPNLWEWYWTNVADFEEWHRSGFSWQFVIQMDLSTLSEHVKVEAVNALKKYPIFDGIVKYIQTAPQTGIQHQTENKNNHKHWIYQLEDIDARRGTSWRDALEIGKYYR
jgi:molybdenum cofactor biosynthesis enzyme MoaA